MFGSCYTIGTLTSMTRPRTELYQTGEGERGSEGAANDLDRLRIRLTDSLKNERRLALTWKLLILERDIIKVLFFVIVKNISLT